MYIMSSHEIYGFIIIKSHKFTEFTHLASGPQEEDLPPCFKSPKDPKDIKNGGQSALEQLETTLFLDVEVS